MSTEVSPQNPPISPTPRPNIIWVFGDQHRAQATGYNLDPNVHTPNMDRLAKEGSNFCNAVAGTPLCCPFRGALITGQYPHQSVPGHEDPMPDGMPTIADAFNAEGYDTAWFGKWHVDGYKESNGRAAFHTVPKARRGNFNRWIGYENNNSQFDCWVHGHDADGNEIEHLRLHDYETDALTDYLLDYLQEQANPENTEAKPFFASLSVQPPHGPQTAPSEWMGRHTSGQVQLRENVPNISRVVKESKKLLAGYYAMIENLDWNLGRVIEALKQLDLYENTIIMFFSDHGDMMGSHGQKQKTTMYEESMRIPMLIGGGAPYYPSTGLVKTQTRNEPMNHVDITATTLGLCGIETPQDMQGFDYAPLIRPNHPDATSCIPPDSALLQLCKSPRQRFSIDRPWRGIVTADGWKYAVFEGQPWMMYNLNDDPYELCNLCHIGLHHDKQRELQTKLAEWMEKTGDSFELPSI